MISLDNFVKKIEEFTPITALFLFFASLVYILNNNIFDFGDKFTIVCGILLAFVAVFYTVIILSEFLKKLNKLNINDIKILQKELKHLTDQELNNLHNQKFDDSSELCLKKSNIYFELSSIKNRKINRHLFISTFLLILMLIIDTNFIPSIIFNIIYKPVVLLIGFWIVIVHIVKIIILFYKVYSE